MVILTNVATIIDNHDGDHDDDYDDSSNYDDIDEIHDLMRKSEDNWWPPPQAPRLAGNARLSLITLAKRKDSEKKMRKEHSTVFTFSILVCQRYTMYRKTVSPSSTFYTR